MLLIKNNPIMTGASGMLGDVVVYRQLRGKTVMSNRPQKRGDIRYLDVLSEIQVASVLMHAWSEVEHDPRAFVGFQNTWNTIFLNVHILGNLLYIVTGRLAKIFTLVGSENQQGHGGCVC